MGDLQACNAGCTSIMRAHPCLSIIKTGDMIMPFIRVDWFPGRTIEQKRELAEVLTREFARIAKCRPETINFIFTEVSRENWGRNGKLFEDSYEYENRSAEGNEAK